MRELILILALCCAAIAAGAGESDGPGAGDRAADMTDSDLALVFGPYGPDLSAYRAILLEPASVSFRKNWLRSQNRHHPHKVKARDVERIRADLAGIAQDVLSEALAEAGYALVSEAGPGVLRIKPAIVNLDLVAPDTRSSNRVMQYTEYGGEMALYLEFYDADGGELLARALDHKRDRRDNDFEWTTRVTNNAMARRMLKAWAKTLREGLDEARVARGA